MTAHLPVNLFENSHGHGLSLDRSVCGWKAGGSGAMLRCSCCLILLVIVLGQCWAGYSTEADHANNYLCKRYHQRVIIKKCRQRTCFFKDNFRMRFTEAINHLTGNCTTTTNCRAHNIIQFSRVHGVVIKSESSRWRYILIHNRSQTNSLCNN